MMPYWGSRAWLTRHNPEINFQTNEVTTNSEPFTAKNQIKYQPAEPRSTGIEVVHLRPSSSTRLEFWRTRLSGNETDENDAVNTGHPIPTVIRNIQQKFSDVFPAEIPDELPPKRSVDHEIIVEAGSTPLSRPACRLSQPELSELQLQLSEMVRRVFLEPSKSPYGAPVFFVKKSDGSFRFVCDWRQLSRIKPVF